MVKDVNAVPRQNMIEHAAQMRFAEDDDVIEARAADGSDQSLHVRILPRT